ncbi:MAG: hypothetical protein ACREOX_03590, partial [Stenotrophomonas sp.]
MLPLTVIEALPVASGRKVMVPPFAMAPFAFAAVITTRPLTTMGALAAGAFKALPLVTDTVSPPFNVKGPLIWLVKSVA